MLRPCRQGLLLLLFICSLARAEAEPAEMREILHIGFQYEYFPHSYLEDGQPRGIDVELIKAAALRAGYEPIMHVMALPLVMSKLQAGELHLGSVTLLPTSPFGKQAKNTRVFERSHTLSKFYTYSRKPRAIELASLANIMNYRVGQHEAAIFYQHPDFPNIRPVFFHPNHRELFSALAGDRVDIAVADEISVEYLQRHDRALQAAEVELGLYIDVGHLSLIASEIALPERVDSVSQQIFKAMQEVKRDGSLKHILRQYQLEHMEGLYLGS